MPENNEPMRPGPFPFIDMTPEGETYWRSADLIYYIARSKPHDQAVPEIEAVLRTIARDTTRRALRPCTQS